MPSFRPAVMSFRCCGLSPSAPPADPCGQLKKVLRVSRAVTGGTAGTSSSIGSSMTRWSTVCFFRRAFSVSVVLGAIESSEARVRTAPIMSSSLSLASTLFRRTVSLSGGLFRLAFYTGMFSHACGRLMLASTRDVRDCFSREDSSGWATAVEGKQELTPGLFVVLLIRVPEQFQAGSRCRWSGAFGDPAKR
ncbi:hypothetical protein RvY_03504-1 [Ramazzottius varieornatus]|uniref:Uncharacterized protein n=1 Tax=Ramazzottius varieornatus TaxID=947166 RepID=A0A1D1UYG8_RAMVA|nr:hypothetical protein RvY_03504-1 [Ramazzottius varieornatus]